MAKTHTIYNRPFGLLCAGSMVFSASYNMLIPELPGYLAGLGGAGYIGLIISLFTLTAGLSRPFSGLLTDKIGRKPVMVFGAAVCVVCGQLYPVLGTVSGFLWLRLVHGFSTGFSPTAITAYVADIIPKARWGEAYGIQGLCFTMGLALGPALGSLIKRYYSYDILFHSSSVMALLSILMIFKLRETLVERRNFKWDMLRLSRREIVSREVFGPALITFLAYSAFGMVLTLIPDWSEHLGIKNKGTFFIVFTTSSLAIRLLAGKISDRSGRKAVILVGLLVLIVALVLMGAFRTATGLLVAGIIYGLSMGILSPALNAWTVDLSPENQRGKGISTMFIALEAGIGSGALFSGWYYQSSFEKIPMTMYGCAFLALLGLFFLVIGEKGFRSRH